MIEIDLLPPELRRKKRLSLPQISNKKMLFTLFWSLLLFHLLLVSFNAINIKRLNSLKKTWQQLSSQKEEISQLKEQLRQINTKIPLIEQLIKDRIIWSKKLNQLSDLMVSGVWLNELSLEKGYLIIQGSCASRAKDEPALIGRFMQNLKEEASFSSDFAEIELGPIKKSLIKQTEIMDFDLSCQFK